jgi:1-acyl-sn-glycerol-3-phosphate acyltransferase
MVTPTAANTSGKDEQPLAAAAEDGQPSRHPYAYADAVPAPVAFVLGAAVAAVRLACLLLGALVYVTFARIRAPRIALTRLAMWCFGVLSLKVDDRRAKSDAAETPIVVLAPHHGLLEGLFAAYYFDARPMMMATFARLPVIGAIVRANGALLVELKRHKKGTSVAPADVPKPSAAARQALATHAAEFKGGRPVAVLPEGTTHNGAALLKFFGGAFAPLAPVQPVCVRYASCVDGSFCGTLAAHLARLLCAPYQRMTVTILPANRPREGEDAPAFAARVRAEMASELRVPLSAYDAKSLNAEYVAARRRRPG